MRETVATFMTAVTLGGILCSGLALPAAAQATRTWVSGVGDDVNPCSRTAPCKTFAGAIGKTAASGEINVIDSGGYGAVTITKSITIDGTGAMASILNAGTNGVVVNAAPTDEIRLINIEINGGTPLAPGLNGVRILKAGSVVLDGVRIYNQKGAAPNGSGVLIDPSIAGTVKVMINDSLINFAGKGVSALGTIGTPRVMVNGSVLTSLSLGIESTGASIVTVAKSTITQNTTGLQVSNNGQITSMGDNMVSANSTNGAFTATLQLK